MTAVTVGLNVNVDKSRVDRILFSLDTAFSGQGLASFLGATVDPYIRERAADRFASEGDDVTGKWLPLASTTQDIRSSMGYGASHPINRRTGELEEYILDAPNRLEISLNGASVVLPGTSPGKPELAKKVRTAQQGANNPGQRPTPARPVMGVNEQDLLWVVTSLAFYAEKAMRV